MPAPIYETLGQKVDDLLTLPAVALHLIERCADPEVRISELVSLISADQVMASRILRLANSPYYARGSSVSTLQDAVMLLGLEAVRAVGLSVGVFGMFSAAKPELNAALEQLWQHSAAVALCSREIARRVRSRDRERAFVAGLLHDIGQLLLAQYMPAEYGAITADLAHSHVPLWDAERAALGADHAEIGAWLLDRWHLPAELRLPVGLHHTETPHGGDEAAASLARIVQVADWLTSTQGLSGPWEGVAATEPRARAELPLDDDSLIQLCLGLDKRVSQLCAAMGLGPVSADLFQRSLYRANRVLAEMTIDVNLRSRRLEEAFEALALVQEVSAILASTDETKAMLDGCVRALCSSPSLESVQCLMPLTAESVLIGSADKDAAGVVSSRIVTSTAAEWQRSQQTRVGAPSYRRESFRLLDGSRAELVVRLAKNDSGAQQPFDLVPFTSILALAFERARAHRDVAQYEERRRNEAIRAQKVSPENEETLASERRLKMLGEMAAGTAHDLNNALAIMLGQAQLGLIADDLAEAREYLTTIEHTAKDCASTVRRLQEFARGARKTVRDDVVDLSAIVRETVNLTRSRWRDEAQRRGVYINVVVDLAEALTVLGSAPSLREVLTNLIFNAVDAMPEGGTLAVRGWVEEGQVHISVRDTGVGMTPEVKERIFEPFFSTKGDKGTGLGLAVSKRIIGEHSGRIAVYSRAGAGSTFVVSLPSAAGAPRPQRDEAKAANGPSLAILVIDDETQVREVLQRMLRLDGHSTVAAATAREGLDLFAKRPFDVVLTDLGLPDLPGWEVARAIKAASPSTPVVLATGWTDEGDRPAGGDNVDSILVKPFGISELRQAVSSALAAVPATATRLSA